MKKTNGFTLIELLAVIVILSIIAIIATPMILGVIEKSKKGSFEVGSYAIIEAADYYRAMNLEEKSNCVIFSFTLGNTKRETIDGIIYEPISALNLKGSLPTEGEMSICNEVVKAKFGNQKYTYQYDSNNKKGEVIEGKPSVTDILLKDKILVDNSGIETIKGKVTPNFNKAAVSASTYDNATDKSNLTKDETGVYVSEDDYGTSYYYRGAVQNNYVIYGGFCWRIIRINGDNSIRVLYQGKSCEATGEGATIGTSPFNNPANDNAKIGYMYGKLNATTYEETHKNTNDSTVKTFIDQWYEKNLKGTTYEKYVGDSIFCNDRSLSDLHPENGTGIGTTTGSIYSSLRLRASNVVPTLKCQNQNDRFTVSETKKGNGALKYPISLITADEASMLGTLNRGGPVCIENAKNFDTYLYIGSAFHIVTLTPIEYRETYYAGNLEYTGCGFLNYSGNVAARSIRPVLNLKDNVTYKGGNGTIHDPYRIY